MGKILISLLLIVSPKLFAMNYALETKSSSNGFKVDLVHLTGYIAPRDVRYIMGYLSALHPDHHTLFILSLGGGTSVGARLLIERLRTFANERTAKGFRVGALVKGECTSMCVPFFYAFDIRYALESSQFGFHSAVFWNANANVEETKVILSEIKQRADKLNDESTLAWLEDKNTADMFRSPNVVYVPTRQVTHNSGLVQHMFFTEQAALDRLTDIRTAEVYDFR